jgi:two-component system sensor histidine kinase RegB
MIKNLKLLVLLRWGAIVFQVLALVGAIAFQLPVQLPLFVFTIGVQCVVNLVTFAGIGKRQPYSEWHVFFQLVFDVVSLNLFMVASGGLANPFSGFFLIQAILAAILLSQVRMWVIIAATGLSYAVLTLGFEPAHMHHGPWMTFHMYGMVVNHVFTTMVIGYFIFKIVSNLTTKEQQLSARQGLVGAGATAAQIAHKLGTPLTVMALVAEGLSPASLPEDKQQLLTEIDRCKAYLDLFFKRLNHLDSGGEVRSLEEILQSFSLWLKRYPGLRFTYELGHDPMLNATVGELVGLLLEILAENAADAKAGVFQVKSAVSKGVLRLDIVNDGPPFPDEIQALMSLGYSRDKGVHHTGIGLFLAKLVMETLGAEAQIASKAEAHLTVSIPLDNGL